MKNDHINRANRWTVLPRGDIKAQASANYVSLTRRGRFALGKKTHERLGSPPYCRILLDKDNNLLGLEPATAETENAYPVRPRGNRGSTVVRAYRLVTEWRIKPKETIEFVDPRINADGVLILTLGRIRPCLRAQAQARHAARKEIGRAHV